MKNSGLQTHEYRLGATVSETRLLATTVTLSFLGHLVLFIVIIFGPSQFASKRYIPTIVNVSLVSLPSPGPPGPKGGAPKAKKKAEVPVKKAPAPPIKSTPTTKPAESKPKVSTAPQKWRPKDSLKQKTFKSEKVVKSAIKRIEEKAEESKPDPITAAIERLREKVGSEEAAKITPKADKKEAETENAGTGTGGSGGSGATGILTSAILVYQQEISYHIRNNWVFSEELAGQSSDLETRLMIKVMANGEIKDIWFERRSGNRHLDESAYKAVMKSNPLPPLPKGYQLYNVGLIFTPSGLQ